MKVIKDYIELFKDILLSFEGDDSAPVEYVSCDSGDLRNNTLFFCKGAHFKEEYLLDALKSGAVCYVSEKKYNTDAPCILVSDVRKAMWLSANFHYDYCWRQLKLVGITGTKGKTTTAYFLKYIFDEYLRKESALLSSIDSYDGIVREPSKLTTPEPLELHKHFDNAVKSGTNFFTMEVSSQALKYGRTAGVNFSVGCYLNIGVDHISAVEHPDFEDYFTSKMKLFSQCKTAVVNLNSDKINEVLKYAKNAPELITFGTKDENADVYGYNIRKQGSDTVFTVRTRDFERDFVLTIPGLFNVDNALCAIAVAVHFGVPEACIYEGLKKARSAGRMEVYESRDKKITVIVDFAHNRLSFESLFESVKREYPERHISIVFGCPGNKAVVRRRDLPEVSSKYADMLYITEDDPAEENVLDICNEIASNASAPYKIIPDRNEAVREAILSCDGESVVLLAGKGNEDRQKRGLLSVACPTDAENAVKFLKEYDERCAK